MNSRRHHVPELAAPNSYLLLFQQFRPHGEDLLLRTVAVNMVRVFMAQQKIELQLE